MEINGNDFILDPTFGKYSNFRRQPECPVMFDDKKYAGTGGRESYLRIIKFTNTDFGTEIRTLNVYGVNYLCYNDLCKALEVKNHADRIKSNLDNIDSIVNEGLADPFKYEYPYMYFNIANCNQYGTVQYDDTLFISESSFYNVLFRSNNPRAIKFTHWVTHEVLPKLREICGTQSRTDMMLSAMAMNTQHAISDNAKSINELRNDIKQQNEAIEHQLQMQNMFLYKDFTAMRDATIDATGKANYMKGKADQMWRDNCQMANNIVKNVGAVAYNSAAAATYYGNMQQQQKQPYPNPDIVSDQY